jgi:small-conductance mechanosensitive channel
LNPRVQEAREVIFPVIAGCEWRVFCAPRWRLLLFSCFLVTIAAFLVLPPALRAEGVNDAQWRAVLQRFKSDIQSSEAQIYEYKTKLAETIVKNNETLASMERRRGQIALWFSGAQTPRDIRNTDVGLDKLDNEAKSMLEPLTVAKSILSNSEAKVEAIIEELAQQTGGKGNAPFAEPLLDLMQAATAVQSNLASLRVLLDAATIKITQFEDKITTAQQALEEKKSDAWKSYYLKKQYPLYSRDTWTNAELDFKVFAEFLDLFELALRSEDVSGLSLIVLRCLLATGLLYLVGYLGRIWVLRLAPGPSLRYARRTWILLCIAFFWFKLGESLPFVLYPTLNGLSDLAWTAALVVLSRFLYSATSGGSLISAGERSLIWPLWALNSLGQSMDDPIVPYLPSGLFWFVLLACYGRTFWNGARLIKGELDRALFRCSGAVLPLAAAMALFGYLNLSFLCVSVWFFLVLTSRFGPSIYRLLDRWRSANIRLTGLNVFYALLSSIGLPIVLLAVLFVNLMAVSREFGADDLLWQLASYEASYGDFTVSVKRVALIVAGYYMLRTVFSLSEAFFQRLPHMSADINEGVADTLSNISRCLWWGGYALAIMFLLGFSLTSLAVVAGGLSVGIGFGLQNMVNNFISGLILIFGRSIVPGDSIFLEGAPAVVRQVGIRNTLVTSRDNATFIVPNSDLVSRLIVNYSHKDPKVRKKITVGVAYGSDTELVTTLLLKAAKEHPEVMPKPPARVLFYQFGDSALNFELQFWIEDVKLDDRVMSELRLSIDEAFRDKGVEIAFPQSDVHLRTAPGLAGLAAPEEQREQGGKGQAKRRRLVRMGKKRARSVA